MARHTFRIGDTIFFIASGIIHESKILGYTGKPGEFLVNSDYLEKSLKVVYGDTAFITREKAIERRRALSEDDKKKQKALSRGWWCQICNSVWYDPSERCECSKR